MRLGAADALELPLLEHAQELGLERERHLADLVEEQGAAVGHLELAGLARHGAGEGALLVAEELAFEQGLGERGAVDGDERLARPGGWRAWRARAASSLPVPLSPRISTVAGVGATLAISSTTRRRPGLSPTRPGPISADWSRRFSRSSR